MKQAYSIEDGDLAEFLTRTGFGRASVRSSQPDEDTRITRTGTEYLVLDDARFGFDFSAELEDMNGILLAIILAGSIEYRRGRVREFTCGGDLALLSPGPFHATVRRMQTLGVIIDPALVRNTAPAGSQQHERGVRFTAFRPGSKPGAELVKASLLYLRDGVLANPLMAHAPLVVSSACQTLAHAILAAFPNDVVEAEPSLTDTRDAGPATLRRAIRFIEDNAHRDLKLADIARAARVTPRSLQYAFARHGDTTPHGYLKRVRLERAHAELKAAQPGGGESVARIAARWGFSNAGRFTTAYRTTYGVSPSTTLRYW